MRQYCYPKLDVWWCPDGLRPYMGDASLYVKRAFGFHNPTAAERFSRLCGWGLVEASKDSHPGLGPLTSYRTCAHDGCLDRGHPRIKELRDSLLLDEN